MGKTKTKVVSGIPEDKTSGEEQYKKKKQKQQKEEDEKKVRIPGMGGGERVVTVDAGPIIDDEAEKEEQEEQKESRWRRPRVRGEKYKKARAKIDRSKTYGLDSAVELVQETSYASFDGTVELHLNVTNQDINKRVKLPHSTGVEKKVEIADEDTIKKLKKGNIDFDVLLAKPEMMPKIVPFAQILGPRGLMPNPKNGTLIKSEDDAKKFSEDSVEIRTEKKQPVIHTIIGKVSFKKKELVENAQAILTEVGKRQINSAYLTSTMSPSVKLSLD